MSVFLALYESEEHLSADQVYKATRKTIPAISLATVYSILEHFCSKGLVKEIKIDFEKSLYEARTDGHHHFLCEKCKKIYDVDIVFCPTLKKKMVDGHLINSFHGYFYGTCNKCKK